MITAKGSKVTITRGDTGYVKINPVGYTLKDDDTIKLQVRKTPDRGEIVFNGRVVLVDKDVVWHIRPNDTQALEVGTYYWDVEIDTASGDVFTYIPNGKLLVANAVTERTVS